LPIRIYNNLVSNSAQRLLGHNADKLGQVFARVSSGVRIQSSADDSAGMMTSELLKSDSRTLKQGIKNLNEGISLLNVADGAIQEEVSIVIRMRELAIQSATGTIGSTERQTAQMEFSSMRSEFDRIAKTTEFNGKKLLDGSLSSKAKNHLSLQFGLNSDGLNRTNINREVNISSLKSQELNLNSLSISTKEGAVNASEAMVKVLEKLSSIRGRLGSTQNTIGRTLNSTLVAIQNLTAAGSIIKDADLASELADLTKHQILVQSSSAMIGQANLFPQGAISLLP
jgi:flagellin